MNKDKAYNLGYYYLKSKNQFEYYQNFIEEIKNFPLKVRNIFIDEFEKGIFEYKKFINN